jgi:RNA polymerase sigma-70 factor (ECF subfamily)
VLANTSPSANVSAIVDDVSKLCDLAAAASDGREASFENLVRALWPNAYRISWSILGDPRDAEDAAQAACAAVCSKLTTLADNRAFVGWAYRIIVSHARDHARVRRRLQMRETVGYAEATTISRRDDPCIRIDLENAIGNLPEVLRLPLELRYFIGLSSREIGHVLGVPATTIRFRLMLAPQRLRPLLSDSTALPTTSEVTS